MKKHALFTMTMIALFALALLTPHTAPAQDAGATFKAAVVDMASLIKDSKKRVQRYAELQKLADSQQKEMDAMAETIKADKATYKSDGAKMADADRTALENKIEAAQDKWKSEMDARQRKIDSSEREIIGDVMKDINAAITKIATEKGYHLVLNSAPTGSPTSPVQYFAAAIDITSSVAAEINK